MPSSVQYHNIVNATLILVYQDNKSLQNMQNFIIVTSDKQYKTFQNMQNFIIVTSDKQANCKIGVSFFSINENNFNFSYKKDIVFKELFSTGYSSIAY